MPEDIEEHIAMLQAAESGCLDSIECPQCHAKSVEVWFTNPVENEYRTWFFCKNCSFHSRAQGQRRPAFYSESRRNKNLEAYDQEILKKRRL